ncbi:MAG: HNH endonuclease [Polaromonas sp.]|nr:HNH endonuclease [Polaromonas sp.]
MEGCTSPSISRGLCSLHYMRDKRAGLFQDARRSEAPLDERFFRQIEKTETCWLWLGRLVGKGYGMIGLGGAGAKQVLSHRLSYQLHKGPIPDGMVIMHKCDNPRCVNPDHLEAGTQSQNIKDAIARGRKTLPVKKVRGEECGASKLNNGIVLSIRESTLSLKALSILHNVSKSAIERIRYRKTWRHI